MKRFGLTWVLLMVWLAGHGQSLALSSLDTLMQTRPESALTVLVEGYERFDTLAVDRHYYHLLLSEALYKNDYTQTDRDALLDAMAYYDSLCEGRASRCNASIPYLAARCHYMNGVGYYEMDSVVPACAEYFKALELMEEHYPEKKLVGEKAKFMALAYTRLMALFSDQYLLEQTVYWGKQIIIYLDRHNASVGHRAWALERIGSHYNMMDQLDSAQYYYQKAMEILPDTDNLVYRDNATMSAMLSYKMGNDPQDALSRLHNLFSQAESEEEQVARGLFIGEIFYEEKQFDSALVWLRQGYLKTPKPGSKLVSALWLKEICDTMGLVDEGAEYTRFIAENTTLPVQPGELHSRLLEQYESRMRTQQENLHRKEQQRNRRNLCWILGCFVIAAAMVELVIHRKRQKQVKVHEEEIDRQKGELLQRDADIDLLKTQIEIEKKKFGNQDYAQKYKSFKQEAACQHIISLIHNKDIKVDQNVKDYKDAALSQTAYSNYLVAIDKYSVGYLERLKTYYPDLTNAELKLCCLLLLNLQNKEMAVLLQITPQAVGKQMKSLQKKTEKTRDGLLALLLSLAFSFGE